MYKICIRRLEIVSILNEMTNISKFHVIYFFYRGDGSWLFHDIVDGATKRGRTMSARPASTIISHIC